MTGGAIEPGGTGAGGGTVISKSDRGLLSVHNCADAEMRAFSVNSGLTPVQFKPHSVEAWKWPTSTGGLKAPPPASSSAAIETWEPGTTSSASTAWPHCKSACLNRRGFGSPFGKSALCDVTGTLLDLALVAMLKVCLTKTTCPAVKAAPVSKVWPGLGKVPMKDGFGAGT